MFGSRPMAFIFNVKSIVNSEVEPPAPQVMSQKSGARHEGSALRRGDSARGVAAGGRGTASCSDASVLFGPVLRGMAMVTMVITIIRSPAGRSDDEAKH